MAARLRVCLLEVVKRRSTQLELAARLQRHALTIDLSIAEKEE